MLDFRVLGPLEVVGQHGAVPLGGPKRRATLAILLLNANRVVSVDRLADDLYSGAPPVTAVTQVQRQISELRKALGDASVIETRAPGYRIRLAPGQLDLNRFERQAGDASEAFARGESERAAALFREALELWRGSPLADLADEPFARTAVERLEEIRLATMERRIDADLACGRHGALAGELEGLVHEHPLRERFRAQLMLALYRSGRQAEALQVYRRTREALVGELGIEPGSELQQLERAILTHDGSLDHPPPARGRRSRSVLALPSADDRLDPLVTVAAQLASLDRGELIVARLLRDEAELARAASALDARRAELSSEARTAAFTTGDPAADAVRLATAYDVDLVLVDAPADLDGASVPAELAAHLERSPGDVAAVAGPADPSDGSGVYVPFGGGEHDWAALELGAWLSLASDEPLMLVGTRAEPRRGERDASRLLADASLALQRVVGVDARPLLAEASEAALVAAVEAAAFVVVGISPRWRREGIGATRRTLIRDGRAPTVLVHRGPRPGGLAPPEARTRFSWTLEARYEQGVSSAAT